MAQQIRNMAASAQLDLSSAIKGEEGMRRTAAAPGPQLMHDPASNPQISNQPMRQMQHASQNAIQRGTEAQFQGMAGAQRNMELGALDESIAKNKAASLLNETKSMILESSDASTLPMLLSDKGLMEKVTRDTMQGIAVAQRTGADLADYSGQLMA